MNVKELLNVIEAKCPFCDGPVGEDYCGNVTCWACRDKADTEGFYEVLGQYVEVLYYDKRKLQSLATTARREE